MLFKKKEKEEEDNPVTDYADYVTKRHFRNAVDTWIPLFDEVSNSVFDVHVIPIDFLKITMDDAKYTKAYGQNGEFILTAKDNSRQVVIDYSTGRATIFTGGVIYLIGKEEAKHHSSEYR